MADWLPDEATTQTRFRAINEPIGQMTDVPDAREDRDLYVLECGGGACHAPVRLTRAEREVVSTETTRFAIASDHENSEIDRLVSQHERHAVVRTTLRMAVRIARETDPRPMTHSSGAEGAPGDPELPQSPDTLSEKLTAGSPRAGTCRSSSSTGRVETHARAGGELGRDLNVVVREMSDSVALSQL